MQEALEILENSISDVEYWRWWTESLPDYFQVEFGGVQLWTPPTQENRPPPGIIALRFESPTAIAFLTETTAEDLQSDWATQLKNDQIEPFSVIYGLFLLAADREIGPIKEGCSLQFLIGNESDLESGSASTRLAFRAGSVGLIVCASSVTAVSMDGDLQAHQISEAYDKWWAYWREYWQRRGSASPLPEDYACEVTIPLDRFELKELT
jgi:hypothetical protein